MVKSNLVYLTGSTGYLGTHIHAYLSSHGYIVRNICMRSGTMPLLRHGIVIHAAAQLQDTTFSTLEEANAEIDRRLVRKLDGASYFVFMSSIAVETRKTNYAYSKKRSEMFFKAECSARNIPMVTMRVPHVFGGPLKENRHSVIHNLLSRAAQGLPLELKQDNEIYPIFIDDFLQILSHQISTRSKGIFRFPTMNILVSDLINQISRLPEDQPNQLSERLSEVYRFYTKGGYSKFSNHS